MQNKPKLRFKEFVDDWQEKSIKDIGYVITGNTPKTDDQSNYGNEYLWCSPADLGEAKYIKHTNKMLSEKGFSQTRKLPPLSILATCIGSTIGKIGMSFSEMSTNQQINSIIPNDDYYNEYIYYALSYNFPKYTSIIATQAVPIINKSQFEKLKINIPLKNEQEKIANFLSKVDELINEHESEVADLETQKKGLMQKLFTQQIRFKDSNGNNYPDWEEKHIGDIYDERSERCNSDKELLSVTMNDGVKKRTEIEGKDNSSEDKSNYKCVYVGDMVYNSMRMWQGANGITDYDGIVSPAYTVMKPKVKLCNDFIKYYFKLPELVFLFRRYSQGLTSDTWNLKYPQIKTLKIKMPELEEQQKIANALCKMDELITEKKALLEDWKQFKKGLLQQMFV